MEEEIENVIWWTNDIIKWDKISKETASLMLSQSEKLLTETTETAKLISVKSSQLIAILISLATLITGYLSANILKCGLNFLTITCILIFTCLIISGIYCYKNLKPYKISVLGDYPHNIVCSKFIDISFDSNQQYLNLLLNICDNLENRINSNEVLNLAGTKNNKKALNFLFMIPFCPVLSYLLCLVFHLHF